jgi:hypothetical protein
MKKQVFLLLALACLISAPISIIAQHTAGPFEALNPIPEGKAVVYIYRVSTYAVAIHYKINANDRPVMNTPLSVNTYMVYIADPGNVQLWAQMGSHKETLDLDLVAGKSYFVEGSVVSDAFVSMPNLNQVSEEKALKRIRKCKRLVE